MAKVTFDYSKAAPFINEDELNLMEAQVAAAKKLLVDRSGAGNDFLGWIDLPVNYDKEEFARIQQAAKKIQKIPRCWLLSVSVDPIWVPVQPSNF